MAKNKYSNIEVVGVSNDVVSIILNKDQWTLQELKNLAAYRINNNPKIHFASIKDIAMCITAESLKPEAQRQKFRVMICCHSFRSVEEVVH